MQQDDRTRSAVLVAFHRILVALARVALRFGVSAGAVNELVRRAFVDAAESLLREQGVAVQTARICALTGLYRKEVVRLKGLPEPGDPALDDRYDRSARVITGWLRDPEFRTRAGQPRVLGEGGFASLVRRYSGDMTARAMREELVRLGAVELTGRGASRLVSRAYVPRDSELDTLQILGSDVRDLIRTVEHNLVAPADQRRFQRKVSYVHLPADRVEPFRRHAARESQALLERLDRWLARHDTEPRELGRPGARLGLGIYQFVEENAPLAEADTKSGAGASAAATGRAGRGNGEG